MNYKIKTFIIFIISITLSYIVAPYSGRLYEKIIGRKLPGGWIGSCPECYEGFLIILTLLLAFLLFAFLNKNRINTAITFALIPALLLPLGRQGDAFLIALGFGLIGLGLGQIIYFFRRKFTSLKKDS